jgi:hypothetical protein
MVDLATVGVAYDSGPLKQLGADLDAVDAKNKQVSASAKDMAASNDAVTASLGRATTAMAARTNQDPDALLGNLKPASEALKNLTVQNGQIVPALKATTDAHAKLGEEAQKTGGALSFLKNLLPGYGSDHSEAAGHVTEHAAAHGALSHASTEFRHAIHALHPVLATAGVGMGELGAFATVARGGIGALAAAIGGTFVAELLKTGEELRKLKEEFQATFGEQAGASMFKEAEEDAKKLGTTVQNVFPAMEAGYRSLQKGRFEAQQDMRKSLQESGTLTFAPGQAGQDAMWNMAQRQGYQFDASSKTGKDIQALIDLFKALGMNEDEAGRKAADFFLALPKSAEQSRAATKEATNDLIKLYEIGGKGGDDAAKATQQMFTELKKGGLSSEAFDKIAEESKTVGQNIAEAFGFKGPEAIDKFSVALEGGAVSLKDVIVALNAVHMKTDEMEVPPGVAKSWSDLKTEFKHAFDVMAEAMDENSAKGSGFAGVLDQITGAIKKLEPVLASAVAGGIKQFNDEIKDLKQWGEDLSKFFDTLQAKIDAFSASLPSWMKPGENGVGASLPSIPAPWWLDSLKNVFTGMANGPGGTPTEGEHGGHGGEHASEQVSHFESSVKDTGEAADHSKEPVYQFQTGVATIGAKSVDATAQLNNFAASIQNVQSAAGSGGGSGTGASGSSPAAGATSSAAPQPSLPSPDITTPAPSDTADTSATADVGANAGGGVYMIGASGGANVVNNNTSGTDSIALRGTVSPGEVVAVIPSAQANSSTMSALQNIIGGTPVSIGGGSVSGGVAPAAAAPVVAPTTALDQTAAGLISSLPVSPFVTALSGYMQAISPSIIGMATNIMNQLHNLTIPFTSLGGGVFANLSGLGGLGSFGGGSGGKLGAQSGGVSFPKDSQFDPNYQPKSDQGGGGSSKNNGPHLDAETMGAAQESRAAAKGTDQPSVFRINAKGTLDPFKQDQTNTPTTPQPDVSATAAANVQSILDSQTPTAPDNSFSPFTANASDYYFNQDTYASSQPTQSSDQATYSPFQDNSYVDTAFNSDTYAPSQDVAPAQDVVDIGANATGGVYTIGGSGTTTKSSGATGTDSLSLSGTVSPGEIVAVIPPDKANQATMDQLQTLINTSPVSIGGGNVTGVGLNESELAAAVAGPAGPTPAGLDPTIRAMMAQLAVIASPAFQAAAGLLGQHPTQQATGGGGGGSGGGGKGDQQPKPQQQEDNTPAQGAAQTSRGAASSGKSSGANVIKLTGTPPAETPTTGGFNPNSYNFLDNALAANTDYSQFAPMPESPFTSGESDYAFDPNSYAPSQDTAYSGFSQSDYVSQAFDPASYAPSQDYATADSMAGAADAAAQMDNSTVDIGDNATGGVYTVGGPGPGNSGDTIKLVGNVSPGEVVAVIPGNNATSQTKQKLSALVSGGGGGPQGLGVTNDQLQSLLSRIMSLYAVSKIQAPSQQPQATGGGGGGGSKGGGDQKPQQQQQQPEPQKGASQASRGSRSTSRNLTPNPSPPNPFQNLNSAYSGINNSDFNYLDAANANGGQFGPFGPTDSNLFDPFGGTYGDYGNGTSNFYDPYSAINPTTSQELGLDNPYFNPYGVGPYAGDPAGYTGAAFDTSNLNYDTNSLFSQLTYGPQSPYDTSNIYNDVNSSFGDINPVDTSAPIDYSAPYNTTGDFNSGGDFSGGDVSAATGGTFEVQNTDGGGTDSVGVNMHVNAGELISVYSQDQLRAMSGGGDPLGTMTFPTKGNKFATGGSGYVINGQFISSPQVIPAAGYQTQAEKAGSPYTAAIQTGNYQIINGNIIPNSQAELASLQAPTSPYFIGPASAKGPAGFTPSYEFATPPPALPGLVLPGTGTPASLGVDTFATDQGGHGVKTPLTPTPVTEHDPGPAATNSLGPMIMSDPGPSTNISSGPTASAGAGSTRPFAAPTTPPVPLGAPADGNVSSTTSGTKSVNVNVFGVSNPAQFVQSRMAINRAMRYA